MFKYKPWITILVAAWGVVGTISASADSVFLKRTTPSVIKHADGQITLDYGSVRFADFKLKGDLKNSGHPIRLVIRESAIPMPLPSTGPEPIGVRYLDTRIIATDHFTTIPLRPADGRLMDNNIRVMPFRYVDIHGWKGEFSTDLVQSTYAVAPDFKRRGSVTFSGSEQAESLNRLWRLMDSTLESTSFAGIFVDGDRERLPYEADGYINALGWYYLVGNTVTPRKTFAYLREHPSWPTEWQAHLIFMAWADYTYSGDKQWLKDQYSWLKVVSLVDVIDDTGLVNIENLNKFQKKTLKVTYPMGNIVDWPKNQRDGHDMRPYNTVTNAFIYRGLVDMQKIALALGHDQDAEKFSEGALRIKQALNNKARDSNGLFVDGVGSAHSSAHSLFIPLGFGLFSGDTSALEHALKARVQAYQGGFPCSIFAAQFMLDAYYKAGLDEDAMALMLNRSLHGWFNMLDKYDSTVTHEAWDVSLKDNEDWTHAWGAAPANIIPKYVIGIQPLEAGWKTWLFRPSPALKSSFKAQFPTPMGMIEASYDMTTDSYKLTVPPQSVALVKIHDRDFTFQPGTHFF